MNNKGIINLQKIVRISIDFRYKHSLFITIINLSKHLTQIKHSLTKLFEIKEIYIFIYNNKYVIMMIIIRMIMIIIIPPTSGHGGLGHVLFRHINI